MRSFLLPALLTLAAALPGCSKPPVTPVSPEEPTYLEVQNQSFYDMTVYAIRSGSRIRLGTVTGNTTHVFTIPKSLVNPGMPLRFQADPIGGGGAPFSQEIVINPGDTLVLRIPQS